MENKLEQLRCNYLKSKIMRFDQLRKKLLLLLQITYTYMHAQYMHITSMQQMHKQSDQTIIHFFWLNGYMRHIGMTWGKNCYVISDKWIYLDALYVSMELRSVRNFIAFIYNKLQSLIQGETYEIFLDEMWSIRKELSDIYSFIQTQKSTVNI